MSLLAVSIPELAVTNFSLILAFGSLSVQFNGFSRQRSENIAAPCITSTGNVKYDNNIAKCLVQVLRFCGYGRLQLLLPIFWNISYGIYPTSFVVLLSGFGLTSVVLLTLCKLNLSKGIIVYIVIGIAISTDLFCPEISLTEPKILNPDLNMVLVFKI